MAQLKRTPTRAGRGVDPRRRRWLYEGLSMPPGVAVVQRAGRPRRAERVLLAGGMTAQSIAPPLDRLAAGGAIELLVVVRPQFTADDWLGAAWFDPALEPDVTLLALEPTEDLLPLQRSLRAHGTIPIWLSRAANVPPATSVVQPPAWSDRMGATAASYAAWAAQVWRQIR